MSHGELFSLYPTIRGFTFVLSNEGGGGGGGTGNDVS